MRHILVLFILLFGTTAQGESPQGSVEISGSLYNPDWEKRENATGLRFSGMYRLGKNFRVRGTYNTIDTDVVNLPVVSLRGLPFANWRELGLAYLWQLTPDTIAELEVSYQALELYDNIESGSGIRAGLNHRISDRFTAAIFLTRFDIRNPDWRLTADLYTALSAKVDLVTRIDDTSKFDFTWYEIGLRIRF